MKHFTTFIFCLLCTVAVSAHAEWYRAERAIMGTSVSVEVEAKSADVGNKATDSVLNEMERINQLMSPYIQTSELWHINENASKGPVHISKEMFDLIERSLEISVETEGAFDITFASVGFHYDYRAHKSPSKEILEQKIKAINYQFILLSREKSTLYFKHPDVKIDLGGIAKGHAVDRAIALLIEQGITSAAVSAGGDSRLLGKHNGRPWIVGIRSPRKDSGVAALLPLSDEAISTSGDYERYFEVNGERIHHILNPKTGKSATGVQSTSVIGPDATTTDAMSTSIFVLGLNRGMQLINQMPALEAVIIDDQGQLHYSKGLERGAD